MELSQEVVLLRDYMMNAASVRGYFDVSNDRVQQSAELIKCSVRDIVDLMHIDGRTDDDVKKALSNVHAVIFHKALQSSGNLHGHPKEYFESVCSSIPYISWPVYIQAVLSCGWQDYAQECWSKLDENVFVETATPLILNLEVLNDDASLKLWLYLLRFLIVLSLKSGNVEENIGKMISSVPSVKLESAKAKAIFEQLEFFCRRHLGNVKHFLDSESSKRILKMLLSESICLFDSLHFSTSSCGLQECVFTVKKLLVVVEEANFLNLKMDINEWLKIVQGISGINDILEAENNMLMESAVKGNNVDFREECLNQLVENLRSEIDLHVISFLASRFHLLNQKHVSTLMAAKLSSKDFKISMKIQQVCFDAFATWDLDVQDAYRNHYHSSFGLEVDPQMTASMRLELTDIANRFVSGDHSVESMAIRDLSRLCWMLPLETLKILVEHAVKNRHIQSVVKALFHLKGSCASKITPDGSSLLICTLKPLMLKKDLLIWTNCKDLVEELLKNAVLDGVDFFNFLVECHLLSSEKQLQMFQIILRNVKDECLHQLCRAGYLAVLLLLVTQTLEECELVSPGTGYAEANSACDLVCIKKESHSCLGFIAGMLNNNPELLSDADRAWLFKSSIKFHRNVRFRLRMTLSNTDSVLTPDDFQNFSVKDLLLIAGVSEATLQAVVEHLCNTFSFTRRFNVAIQQALVKILPRLTAVELRAAMDVAIMCHKDDLQCNASGPYHVAEAIRIFCESLVVLLKMGHLTASQELRIVEDLMTTTNAIVEFHRPPHEVLAHIIFILVHLSMDIINPNSSVVPKLLIGDLMRRRTQGKEKTAVTGIELNYAMVAMVACLNDEALYDAVKTLLNIDFNVSSTSFK